MYINLNLSQQLVIKQVTSVVMEIITIGLIITWYWYFMAHYQYAFNYENNLNGQYLSGVLVSVPVVTLIIYRFKHFFKYAFSFQLTLVYNIIGVYLALAILGNENIYSNDDYKINVISFLIAYLFFRGLNEQLILKTFIIYTLFWLYELLLTIEQLITSYNTYNYLNVQGSFLNSGVLACFLSIQLPLILYLLSVVRYKIDFQWHMKRKVISYTYYTGITVLSLFVLYIDSYVQSRSSLLCLFASSLAYCYFKYKKKLVVLVSKTSYAIRTSLLCGLFTLLICTAYRLFYLKELSALGRFMKVQIAWQHMTDNFWLGTGLGRFTWYYPQWQSSYFLHHPDTSGKFFLIADESYILFNEYLQLFETIGFVGFAGFLLLLYYFFNAKSAIHGGLLNAIKSAVIGILTLGFTAYPFHVNIMLLFLVTCFGAAEVLRNDKWRLSDTLLRKNFALNNILKGIIYSHFLFILMYFAYSSIRQYHYYKKWDNIRYDYTVPRIEAKALYADLYPALRYDGKFLTEYGLFLMQDNSDYQAAIGILEAAKKKMITSQIVSALGNAYAELKNYPKAIENYRWLVNYLPNRFGYKYELLKLYKESGDRKNAQFISKIILTMPIKIPSEKVEKIKEDTRKMFFEAESRSH